mmetsp:Transcript_19283/g.28728  ORF Transcript_19283/g.28728 Transcript_19283/m.28728 type:complete len:101 (+) Transcript_19283:2044-2346(+)
MGMAVPTARRYSNARPFSVGGTLWNWDLRTSLAEDWVRPGAGFGAVNWSGLGLGCGVGGGLALLFGGLVGCAGGGGALGALGVGVGAGVGIGTPWLCCCC